MTAALEQHFTPNQLAKLWGVSVFTIRRWFRNEPGILQIDRPEQLHKRGYTTMRIPASVAQKVYAKNVSH